MPTELELEQMGRDLFVIEHPLVYLACPYSHPERLVRIARFEAANKVAGELMREGLIVFSPISHTHPIAEAGTLPLGWEFWAEYDRAFISCCHKLFVLMLDGWKESVGVTAEIEIAVELRIEIVYLPAPEMPRTMSPEDAAKLENATIGERFNHSHFEDVLRVQKQTG